MLVQICSTAFFSRLFFSLFGALRVGEVVLEFTCGRESRGLLLQDVTLSPLEVVLFIRNSKTDQLGRGATLRLPATGNKGPCPVEDTSRYLDLRPQGEGPFLIHEDGAPLARHQFAKVMRKAIAACGLKAAGYAPHSFRNGAATTAAHWGLSVERIKNMGLWKSNAFCGYVHRHR